MLTRWHELGRIEGRAEGIRESIRRFSELRLGTMPPEIAGALERETDPAALESLVDAAARSESWEEFRRALPATPAESQA